MIGAEGVPVGDYTRAVLAQLGPERSAAILANVRSDEPDVKGVVGKLTQGAADAGFVYVERRRGDGRRAAGDRPAGGPRRDGDATGPAWSRAASSRTAAEAFVDDLLAGGCHDALLAAGFGEP